MCPYFLINPLLLLLFLELIVPTIFHLFNFLWTHKLIFFQELQCLCLRSINIIFHIFKCIIFFSLVNSQRHPSLCSHFSLCSFLHRFPTQTATFLIFLLMITCVNILVSRCNILFLIHCVLLFFKKYSNILKIGDNKLIFKSQHIRNSLSPHLIVCLGQEFHIENLFC